jgi:ribosomal protein L20
MPDDRTVKKVFLEKSGGRRKAGRPKLRWLDSIENDLRYMCVKRRRKKAEGRSVWVVIVKEALVKL